MAVSKRTRFEVLRRDNHICRYCGASTPDVHLTIDHVLPVALGGDDSPSNLVAACDTCNSGKSSTSPTEQLVADVDADTLRWAAARQRAVMRWRQARNDNHANFDKFFSVWVKYDTRLENLPANAPEMVYRWLAEGLEIDDIIDATHIAWSRTNIVDWAKFRYLVGICRRKIEQIDALTTEELEDGDL